MPSRSLYHNIDVYSDHARPAYVKQINDKLAISLTYLDNPQQSNDSGLFTNKECLISFHNISNSALIINPTDTEVAPIESENELSGITSGVGSASGAGAGGSWFGGLFRSSLESTVSSTTLLSNNGPNNEIQIFLGNVQLIGYLVLNYKLGVGAGVGGGGIDLGGGPKYAQWWNNREYTGIYQEDVEEELENEEERESRMASIPFIRENLTRRLTVGGKLGGINDLGLNKNDSFIDESNKYLVHDLIYTFNTHLPPKFKPLEVNQDDIEGKYKIPTKELTDSIIPFYTTSQALLFMDLSIPPSSTKTFHIKFPQSSSLPPSYNTKSTGPTCDQGWLSIKYSLVVSISPEQHLKPKSVYFPLDIKSERVGLNDRWYQRSFFEEITVDKSWKIGIIESKDTNKFKDNDHKSIETREVFLEDLTKLIDSDLYSMPKMSTNERKKSIPSLYEESDITEGTVPQLPSHLKTQFQLKVNNHSLCLISLSRPYYHIGDDIHFVLDINPLKNSKVTKVVGLLVYLEAHEIYHTRSDNLPEEEKPKDYTNTYRVTGSLKFNTFATSLFNKLIPNSEHRSAPLNGCLNIPRHLSQQFQSTTLMDLKYYIVFKFNLGEFNNDGEVEENGGPTENNTEITNGGSLEPQDTVENGNGSTNGNDESNQQSLLGSSTDGISSDSHSLPHNERIFEAIETYRVDTVGSELRFRLPLILLP
ncbi:Rgp1-domain-containing protein [Scheffersomyces amazonensis]|uniref:Rgp1-domain-containing protein n=1 Tax=Scheffersomyces amazonensis TaxID=1078765 RepID=UPI00315CA6A2